ncbi:hypothetical protein GQ42DRAFT_162833 [Ramicandelaber brevisporus]|nr:hypothetical protein GQ42DRAFT_162833 [Ramicandelaber brevisporus]
MLRRPFAHLISLCYLLLVALAQTTASSSSKPQQTEGDRLPSAEAMAKLLYFSYLTGAPSHPHKMALSDVSSVPLFQYTTKTVKDIRTAIDALDDIPDADYSPTRNRRAMRRQPVWLRSSVPNPLIKRTRSKWTMKRTSLIQKFIADKDGQYYVLQSADADHLRDLIGRVANEMQNLSRPTCQAYLLGFVCTVQGPPLYSDKEQSELKGLDKTRWFSQLYIPGKKRDDELTRLYELVSLLDDAFDHLKSDKKQKQQQQQ